MFQAVCCAGPVNLLSEKGDDRSKQESVWQSVPRYLPAYVACLRTPDPRWKRRMSDSDRSKETVIILKTVVWKWTQSRRQDRRQHPTSSTKSTLVNDWYAMSRNKLGLALSNVIYHSPPRKQPNRSTSSSKYEARIMSNVHVGCKVQQVCDRFFYTPPNEKRLRHVMHEAGACNSFLDGRRRPDLSAKCTGTRPRPRRHRTPGAAAGLGWARARR